MDHHVYDLFHEIQTLQVGIETMARKQDEKMAELKRICPHEMTIVKKTNREAGYDYVAEYTTDIICSICGQLVSTSTKYGSSRS